MDKIVKEVLPSIQEQESKTARKLKNKKNVLILASGGVLLVIVLTLVVVLLSSNKNPQNATNNNVVKQTAPNAGKASTPTLRPTPTPTIIPLPKGPQVYAVSSQNAIAVKQLWISNLATNIGDSQEMKLTIKDPSSSVNSVTINLITDHKKELHSLSLISGSGKDGVWDGSWKTDDTHDITYQAQITIKDQAGKVFSFTPSFR